MERMVFETKIWAQMCSLLLSFIAFKATQWKSKITRMSSASTNNRTVYFRLSFLHITNLKSGENSHK